jgi:hypothetical protein
VHFIVGQIYPSLRIQGETRITFMKGLKISHLEKFLLKAFLIDDGDLMHPI